MYEITFTDAAKDQYDALNPRLKSQIDKGLDRIAKNPKAGKPLRAELKGIWSERVATFRILYRILEFRVEVIVLVIEHRKKVYGGH